MKNQKTKVSAMKSETDFDFAEARRRRATSTKFKALCIMSLNWLNATDAKRHHGKLQAAC